jgi:hypothetical protein
MKRDAIFFSRRLWTLILTVLLVPIVSAAGQNPRLHLPDLGPIAARASNSVDITLDGALLNLAARFFDAHDENERAVKEMLGAVKGIYVKTFEFDKDGGYSSADLDAVRHQLSLPGWTHLAGVRSGREQTQVDVYMWMEGDKPGGLAVLSIEPRHLAIVNIVGAIDLDKLRALEGQFGVPKLDLERRSKDDRKRRDDQ